MKTFTAMKDFWSDDTCSQYCTGMTYTVAEPDAFPDESIARARANLLAMALPLWVAEGKIREGGPVTGVKGG